MNKNNFLSVTLIISGLALNPLFADSVQKNISYTKSTHSNLASKISLHLFSKGIEKDTADNLAYAVISESNEIMLSVIMEELEMKHIVKQDDVLAFLSSAALHKEKVDFTLYDNLVGMVTRITKKPLDKYTSTELNKIVKVSKQLFV